jgi:hypothetical protein
MVIDGIFVSNCIRQSLRLILFCEVCMIPLSLIISVSVDSGMLLCNSIVCAFPVQLSLRSNPCGRCAFLARTIPVSCTRVQGRSLLLFCGFGGLPHYTLQMSFSFFLCSLIFLTMFDLSSYSKY